MSGVIHSSPELVEKRMGFLGVTGVEENSTGRLPCNDAVDGGGPFLGCPPPETGVTGVETPFLTQTGVENGVESASDVADEEARQFYADASAQESAAQISRRNLKARVFSILQFERNPKSGQRQITQGLLDAGLEMQSVTKWAYAWHDRDRYTAEEVADALARDPDSPIQEGEAKPLHVHLVIECKERVSIDQISRWFSIPSARIRIPKEEGAGYRGHGAAQRAFFDYCEYLTHEDRRQQKKAQYPDDVVVTSGWNFREELDDHVARRGRGRSSGGGSLAARKRELRRRVGNEGLSLEAAREEDFDAWADDLPRLRQLAAEWGARPENLPPVGRDFSKAIVGVFGEKRHGKDAFAKLLAECLCKLVGQVNLQWSVAVAAGRNALEGVGHAEVIRHEDVRFHFMPTYDEALRYLDPNSASPGATRFHNTAAHAPRVITFTSTETPQSLALGMKTRKSGEELQQDSIARTYAVVDVDEMLLRLGYVVEVRTRQEVLDQKRHLSRESYFDLLEREAIVSVSKMHDGGPEARRSEYVADRWGANLGSIKTSHIQEQVALVKGLRRAASMLAGMILEECSPDVWTRFDAGVQASLRDAAVSLTAEADAELIAEIESARLTAARLDTDDSSSSHHAPLLVDGRTVYVDAKGAFYDSVRRELGAEKLPLSLRRLGLQKAGSPVIGVSADYGQLQPDGTRVDVLADADPEDARKRLSQFITQ